jgi:Na+/H+ antiporter
MQISGIHNVELIFLLLLFFVAGLAALAKRYKVPYPIVLVIGGLILSFLPRAPRVELNPDLIFLVVLPPLLFSSAFLTSWRDFRFNLVSITMLAFGLVGFTVFGVAAASRWILPGFDWRTGLVLGAVVSTTDAIAITAIAQRLGLPRRILDVIEGESLLNDASGLLALQFATVLLVTGHTPSIFEGVGRLLYLVLASIAIGLVIAKLIRMFLLKIEDAPIEITISLLTPYFAYLAAEAVHSSGVLATVACGLYLGHKSSLFFSMGARLKAGPVWDTLTFILNGFVFIVIGLQLPWVLEGIGTMALPHLLVLGLLFSGVVILLRFLWVYPGAWISNSVRRYFFRQPEPLPSPQSIFVVGWAGMRGVIALAAAISLPLTIENGSPFPERNVIIFLTFCVIFVTLVLQGLTLPAVIRSMGLSGKVQTNPEEEKARRAMVQAAVSYLDHARDDDQPQFAPVYDELSRLERRRLNLIYGAPSDDSEGGPEYYDRARELSRHVRALQRATLLHMRNENEINDEVMRKLENEIDSIEARASAAQTH